MDSKFSPATFQNILHPDNITPSSQLLLSSNQSFTKTITLHIHVTNPGQVAIDNNSYNSIASILLPNTQFKVLSGKLQNNDNIPSTVYTVSAYIPFTSIPDWYKFTYTPTDHFHEQSDLTISY